MLIQNQPLVVMVSSRCRDQILLDGKQQEMTVLRRRFKQRLEAMRLGGQQVFVVWIHEDQSAGAAEDSTWEACMKAARGADIVLLLYNGNSGWQGNDELRRNGIGICHAEASEAFSQAPAKVHSIQFTTLVKARPGSPEELFQRWFRQQNIPGAQVADGDEALRRVDELAAAVLLSLARRGVGYASRGSAHVGAALEWSRMNFERRRAAMVAAVRESLPSADGDASAQPHLVIADRRVGVVVDAVPAAMSTAAARELVGQPFLADHEHVAAWPADLHGPVHLVACQKGVTESQALRQLGFPDAILVSAPFGVYVADRGQRIQMAFLAHCRDETTTKKATQEFVQWLASSGEATFLAERAVVRRRLCDLMRQPDPAAAASARRKRRKPS